MPIFEPKPHSGIIVIKRHTKVMTTGVTENKFSLYAYKRYFRKPLRFKYLCLNQHQDYRTK